MSTNQERINRITEEYKARVKYPNQHSVMDLDVSFLLEMIKKYQAQIQELEALSVYSVTEEEVERWYKEENEPRFMEVPLTVDDCIEIASRLRNHDDVIDSIRDYRDVMLGHMGFYERDIEPEVHDEENSDAP